MNAIQSFAAAVVFVTTGSALAADAPVSNAAAVAATAAAASAADKLNLPRATVGKTSAVLRAVVQAEAAQFVQHHKTALAVQLEHYKP